MSKGFLYDTGDELITREDVNEVPDGSTSSAGDVLSLDSNKKPKWTTPESGLPDTASASAGDVLSLDSDKKPVWSAPSGGGGGGIFVVELDVQSASDIISDGEGGSYYKTNATMANTTGIGKIPVCGEFDDGAVPALVGMKNFPIGYKDDYIKYNTISGDVYLETLDDHGDTLYYHVEAIT